MWWRSANQLSIKLLIYRHTPGMSNLLHLPSISLPEALTYRVTGTRNTLSFVANQSVVWVWAGVWILSHLPEKLQHVLCSMICDTTGMKESTTTAASSVSSFFTGLWLKPTISSTSGNQRTVKLTIFWHAHASRTSVWNHLSYFKAFKIETKASTLHRFAPHMASTLF